MNEPSLFETAERREECKQVMLELLAEIKNRNMEVYVMGVLHDSLADAVEYIRDIPLRLTGEEIIQGLREFIGRKYKTK